MCNAQEMLVPLAGARAGSILGVWVAFLSAGTRADRLRDDPTTTTSTRPGDHVRVNHAHPRCGIGQRSV